MDNRPEGEVVHRELDTDRDDPAVAIAEIVADLEGKDERELATIWGCIDDVLDHVFSNPPSPEAQIRIAFSYEGYRIAVEQDGSVRLVETASG